jgi:hypothetical protein
VEPTPTPETTTATPIPPEPQTCELIQRVAVSYRSEPRIAPDTRIGTKAANTYNTIQAFYQDGSYLWADDGGGWWAVRQGSSWWAYGTNQSANCPNVDGWPDDLEPPAPITFFRVGPHMLFNASTDRLAGLLAVAGVVKEVSGDGHLLRFAESVNPDVVTVYRFVDHVVGNCQPDWMDGRQWVDALVPHWPPGYDFYEVQNECIYWSRAYSTAAVIETMERANELGICLLLYSFGVGHPPVEWFPTITPVLDYALAHECQPGRHHELAMHAYGLGYPRDDMWRFSLWRQLCATVGDYCERVGVWMTEWGWYDQESDPVDCALEVENVQWALREYKDTPIRGVMLWSFGALQPWRDVTPCAGQVAGAIG